MAEQLAYDYRQAGLSPSELLLCDYSVKLTLATDRMTAADVEELRTAGWTDKQIHHAAQVIGYFNYINRVAEGLHVDPEEWMTPPVDQWKKAKAQFR